MNEIYSAYANYQFSDLFGSVVKQQIIQFLSENSKEEFSVLAISRALSLNQSSVSKPLDLLDEIGILHSNKIGKYRYYKLKETYARHFRDIFKKLRAIRIACGINMKTKRYDNER